MVKNANRSGGIIRGGARPKTSVVDEAGHLYIAKFPSVKDEYDVGGWEMVVNALAVGCGLNVAPAQAHKFASNYHCFMVRRFDRTNAGRRLHFASAMTLTRHQDGELTLYAVHKISRFRFISYMIVYNRYF